MHLMQHCLPSLGSEALLLHADAASVSIPAMEKRMQQVECSIDIHNVFCLIVV